MTTHSRLTKNVARATARRQKNLDAMRGRCHEKTSAAWATELGMGVDAILKYAKALGERCARVEVRAQGGNRGNQYTGRSSQDDHEAARMMAQWATRPIR